MSGRLDRLGPTWPHRTRSELVAAAGMRFHVQRFSSTGPVALLLHGTGSSTHSFRDLAPAMSDGFRVVAIDLPGHAGTDTPRGDGLTLPGMARRIGDLCRALELQPDLIVGHSAGAAIAIQMAIDGHADPRMIVGLNAALEPMQGYALFSPLAKALFLNPLVPSLFTRVARRPTTVRRLIEQTGSRIDETGMEGYARLFAQPDHVYGALGMMAGWDLPTLRSRLPELRCPLVLVTAADDGTVPARDADGHVARVRDGRHVALAEGGHLLHEARPEEIAALVHELFGPSNLPRGALDETIGDAENVSGTPPPMQDA